MNETEKWYKEDGLVHPYPEVYLSDIVDTQAIMFMRIRDYLKGVDEKWYIHQYMHSNVRQSLDRGDFVLANAFYDELVDKFLKEEVNGEYIKGETWGGFLPEWVGSIYAIYQWKYNVTSKWLISHLPLEEMERLFGTLHQTFYEVAVEKIYQDTLDENNSYSKY